MATLTTDQQAVLHAHLALQAVHVRRAPTVRVYEADPGTQQASLDELFSVIHNPSANVGMPLRDRQLPPSFWTPPQLMQTSSEESNQSRSRSGSGNPPTPTSPVTAKTSPRTPRQRKPRMCCVCFFCCQYVTDLIVPAVSGRSSSSMQSPLSSRVDLFQNIAPPHTYPAMPSATTLPYGWRAASTPDGHIYYVK